MYLGECMCTYTYIYIYIQIHIPTLFYTLHPKPKSPTFKSQTAQLNILRSISAGAVAVCSRRNEPCARCVLEHIQCHYPCISKSISYMLIQKHMYVCMHVCMYVCMYVYHYYVCVLSLFLLTVEPVLLAIQILLLLLLLRLFYVILLLIYCFRCLDAMIYSYIFIHLISMEFAHIGLCSYLP